MVHFVFFDHWNFIKAALLKSKYFCLVGDKLGVGIGVQITALTRKEKKKTPQVLCTLLRLGKPSYSVPMMLGGSRY